jgi:hypothetical protein
VLDDRRYAKTPRLALVRAKITDYVRPFHDGRHTSLTNAAAAWMSTQARAGNSDFKTTLGLHPTGRRDVPREEDLLEARLFGQRSGHE